MSDLLLTYYGDDFTGSTDALEALSLGGVPAMLFLEPPSRQVLATQFPHIRAVGVPGISRSLTPEQMEETLPPIFAALQQLGAPLCHYKVCSTFDSSPTIGSIGRALNIGCRVFSTAFVPLLVGAPALRRYVAFGNLFATVGDETVRLDRHPTMSKHPITPMDESDLRRHLAKQTDRGVGLVDLVWLERDDQLVRQRVAALRAEGRSVVLFDTLNDEHLLKAGQLILTCAAEGSARFVVGSSGVEYALTAAWRKLGVVQPASPLASPGAVPNILVMSGSASPVTAEQIAWAEHNGFLSLRLNVQRLIDPETVEQECDQLCAQVTAALDRGQSVVCYSARGPDDASLPAARAHARALGPHALRLGQAQGRVVRGVLERTAIQRLCIAGGDTCGQVVRQLGIDALSMRFPLAPGGPLCRAHSRLARYDGLELSLKGGQVGEPDYFARVLRGQ